MKRGLPRVLALSGVAALLVSCSTSFMTDSTISPYPGPRQARVVVYRPSPVNASRAYAVYDGDQLIGFAESGARFEYLCDAGEHLFMQMGSSGVTETAVMAILKAGYTYYLRSDTESELFTLRVALVPVTPGSPGIRSLQGDLEACEPRELDAGRAEDFIENRRERVAERLAYFKGVGEAGWAVLRPGDGLLESGAETPVSPR